MTIFKTAALAAAFAASSFAANATTYTINSIIDSNANGFGSSGFHGQTCGQMCGSFIDKFDELAAPMGAWDTSIAAGMNNIYFSGELVNGGTVTALGRLDMSTSRVDGVVGEIEFKVTGSSVAGFDAVYTMIFADASHVSVGTAVVANGIFGDPTTAAGGVIGLWGDQGNFVDVATCTAGGAFSCLGMDLRLNITQGGTFNEPEPVPLPATLGFLLLGLGGLAATKRRKA